MVKMGKPILPKNKFPNIWKPQQWKPVTFKQQPFNFRPPKRFMFNIDTDRDGVPNWKDCQPLNPRKQDITVEDIKKDPKLIQKISFDKYQKLMQKESKKAKVIKIVNGFEIIKAKGLYHARDRKTKVGIAFNRKSLTAIEKDIRTGVVDKAYKDYMKALGAKNKQELAQKEFESTQRTVKYGQQLGQLQKRFPKVSGERVLDMGAGDAPDARATHAIDLRKPEHKYPSIKYKYGYNLQKLSVLPYSSQLFDRVVSYGALGMNFETRNIYKEIYRILKSNGKLEIAYGGGREKQRVTQQYMKDAGFVLSIKKYYDPVDQKQMSVLVGTKM